jgi:hypothetical protein
VSPDTGILVGPIGRSQAEILDAWRDLIFASFPAQTARFLKGQPDRFQNPLGHFIRSGTQDLLDGLLAGRDPRELTAAIDALVRMRAVQGQRPSQALEFVFLLKRALRDILGEAYDPAFDGRVDGLALVAFDVYMGCREEIHEIRLREARRRVGLILERFSGDEPGPIAQQQPTGGHAAAPAGDGKGRA